MTKVKDVSSLYKQIPIMEVFNKNIAALEGDLTFFDYWNKKEIT